MKKSLLLIMLLCLWGATYAQQTVRGRITSKSDGEGVPGATVQVKGTTTGTITDIDGNYTLQVPSGATALVIRFTGYISQEININNRTNINVELVEDVDVLDAVVVTGYGDIRNSEKTGAQTTISSEQIQKTLNNTVEQGLQGRAPGVYITQNTGAPGGGISVNVRGINSINGTNEPLYVIDGVQIQGSSSGATSPMSGINPADIESYEVLQGPAATAIYGSRATNGVIVITTKRGKAGEATISYGYQFSLTTPPKQLKLMNLRQYAQMRNEYHEIAGGTSPEEFLDPSILGEGTNWQNELFRTAPRHNHQLSLSGGTDKTTYYLSGEYLNHEGIALASGFKRYGLALNMDNKPRKWLSVGTNLKINQREELLGTNDDNIIAQVFQQPPHIPVRNLDGTYGSGDPTRNPAETFTPPNPIAIANMNTNNLVRRQALGGLAIGIDIIEGLKFTNQFDVNYEFSKRTLFQPSFRFGAAVRPETTLDNTEQTNTWWRWMQMLQYTKQLGKHGINAMATHEAQASTWQQISASRAGFVVNDLIDLNLGDPNRATNGGGQGDWAMESYLARLIYNFDERYIIQGAFRADGSVNFGPDNRWGYFPSVSAAWRISEESFFQVPFVSDLRLRLESGLTGSQGEGQGIYGTLGTGISPWGTGFLPNSYANPGFKWEETLTNNIGITLGLLKNRVQLEADFYVKNTDNLILRNPLPWYMGTNGQGSVAPPWVNIGELENRGWNLQLITKNIDNGNLKWETTMNLSGFKAEIKQFYSENAFINRTSWWMNDWTQRAEVGQAPWFFYGYQEEGIFQNIAELENSALPADNTGVEYPIDQANIWVGDVKYKDVNGDGIIDAGDLTNIGSPWPKLFAGLTNDFSYKGLTLSVFVTSTYGNEIYNFVRFQNSQPNNINLGRNLLVSAFDYARIAEDENGNPYLLNPGTNVARISPEDQNDNYNRHTSKYVEDGSFIRLKNIALNYNLPTTLVSKQGFIKAARIGFSAQNVATFTKYTGYDPEVGAYVGRGVSDQNQAIGVDNGRYPLTPIYTVNVGIDF